MNARKVEILEALQQVCQPLTAEEVAELVAVERSNASRYLNELAREGQLIKKNGRPVRYRVAVSDDLWPLENQVSFANLVGTDDSLKVCVQQAKAATLYPPNGLHTILFGETGTGKSMFAECMHQYVISSATLQPQAPFVAFNCADYAQNPQLLVSQIFGVKQGAYTGATEHKAGLLEKAHGGMLFLDEIHWLPPEGQEMLFTFIDKGHYRPLGETSAIKEAKVRIIGATTEHSETFLKTFTRRIPMAITLPAIQNRNFKERFEIIVLFIKQEATRLHQQINIEKEALLAFMLYQAEGNIGQIKRDLKLVCAKAFLHYRTHQSTILTLKRADLPVVVKKGLLRQNEVAHEMSQYFAEDSPYLSILPGEAAAVWHNDPERDMTVYNAIEEKVTELAEDGIALVDLEQLISTDIEAYFDTYVDELTQNTHQQELLSKNLWQLTGKLYQIAEEKLQRHYSERARMAFALHLQSTLERIRRNQAIIHPDLNDIRKNLKSEFQVALDLSTLIEAETKIDLPFDELGFISMFLAIPDDAQAQSHKRVTVIVAMHGESTATSMLNNCQKILNTSQGMALDMPDTLQPDDLYQTLRTHLERQQPHLQGGVLLLTDMGSLNSLGAFLEEETGVTIQTIPMASTLTVLESLRLACLDYELAAISQEIHHLVQTELAQFSVCVT